MKSAQDIPEGGDLLLFPTELELRRFQDQGGIDLRLPEPRPVPLVCGFGVVAAAARSSQLIARHRPRRLILIGIAGAYDVDRHPVGSAWSFDRVAIDGIGAGSGANFRGPTGLGFPQWPGSPTDRAGDGEEPRSDSIGDEITLSIPAQHPDSQANTARFDGGLLLTTCAASASPAEAGERIERHPDATAEDMEGFAVAFAGALAEVPVTIVRGISNRVGDRDPKSWRIPSALAAARRVLGELLGLASGADRP